MGIASSTLSALLLVGCPAEQLGVPLPPRGEAAIGQDDVQRDLYLLTPGAWNLVDPEEALLHRLDEVGLKPAFGGDFTRGADAERIACGRAGGDPGPALLLLTEAEGLGVSQSSLRAAELISLAKSVDGLDLGQPVLFCYLGAAAGPAFDAAPPLPWAEVGGIVVLGPLTGPALAITDPPWRGHAARLIASGPDTLAGSEADGIERLDFRVIDGNLRAVHREVLAGLIKDPPSPSPPPPPR
jgi:hypothetical protein